MRRDIAFVSVELKKHTDSIYYCEWDKKFFLININKEKSNAYISGVATFDNESDLKNAMDGKNKKENEKMLKDGIYEDNNYSYKIGLGINMGKHTGYSMIITRLPERNIVNKFISQFLIEGEYFVGHTPHIENGLFQTEYFNSTDVSLISLDDLGKFDKIVLDTPIGLNSISVRGMSFRKLDFINLLCNNLNKGGIMIVSLLEGEIKKLEKILPNRILGLFESHKGSIEFSAIRPIIAVISKDEFKKDNLFIASFEDGCSSETIYNNFIGGIDTKSIKDGMIINKDNFRGFNAIKVSKEIEKLKSQYKEFNTIKFGKIIIEIINKATEDDEKNSLYLSKNGGKKFIESFSELKKPENYYQIKLKNDKITKDFLINYFKTDIGQLSLQTCMDGSIILRVNKDYLLDLDIPYLKPEMQEKLGEAYNKLANLKEMISNIEKELSLNPKNIDIILGDLDEKKVKQISETDELNALIRQGEGDKLEFKKTFSKAVENNAPTNEIRKESLKNIAGFMNKFGGTLLVGVADNGEIFGIEHDNFKTNDDYLKTFKDVVKTAFTTTNVLDMLDYRIIEIDGKKVLRVDCPMSRDLVYLEKEQDGAYVRNSPSVDKKMGKDLVDYTKTHAEDYDLMNNK